VLARSDPAGGALQDLGGLPDELPALLDPPALRGPPDQPPPSGVAHGDAARHPLVSARRDLEARFGQEAGGSRETGRRLVNAPARGTRVHRARVAVPQPLDFPSTSRGTT